MKMTRSPVRRPCQCRRTSTVGRNAAKSWTPYAVERVGLFAHGFDVCVPEIPHFKEVVIMATVCDFCGHKTNEVKSGGGIEPQGTKITLKVTDPTDLSRDVLKAETCNVALPDLDFEIGGFALGGRFTTLEGLLQNILEKVEDNPFLGTASSTGDSTTKETQNRLQEFNTKLQEFIGGSKTFTVVLDDPTGNSYLQNLYAPDPDPEMTIEHYDRSFEQNEDLGLNDMKTENYGEHEILATETTPLDPTQQAHLLELGASTQNHLYVKKDKNLLTPGVPNQESRRVSATKSATSSMPAGSEAR